MESVDCYFHYCDGLEVDTFKALRRRTGLAAVVSWLEEMNEAPPRALVWPLRDLVVKIADTAGAEVTG